MNDENLTTADEPPQPDPDQDVGQQNNFGDPALLQGPNAQPNNEAFENILAMLRQAVQERQQLEGVELAGMQQAVAHLEREVVGLAVHDEPINVAFADDLQELGHAAPQNAPRLHGPLPAANQPIRPARNEQADQQQPVPHFLDAEQEVAPALLPAQQLNDPALLANQEEAEQVFLLQQQAIPLVVHDEPEMAPALLPAQHLIDPAFLLDQEEIEPAFQLQQRQAALAFSLWADQQQRLRGQRAMGRFLLRDAQTGPSPQFNSRPGNGWCSLF